MEHRIDLSIVVPTYQRLAILRRSLPSVLAQDLEAERFEVVVVVDGSTDGTREFLARRGESALRVVEQPNRGLAAARNRGADEARGRVLLFLDDDAHASPGLARTHLGRHADGRDRVVQGPFPLLPEARRSFLSAGVERWADDLARRLSTPGYRPHHTDVSFANTSMPRRLWETIGRFHEGFRRFGNEDYEMAIRLIAAGVELAFEPAAVAWQDYRKDFRTWCREWREVGRADLGLFRLHPAVEPDLAFSRIESLHPLRRLALRGGLRGSRLAGPIVAPLTWLLSLADRLGLRGRPFDLLKWIPADSWYGRGLRDALRDDGTAPAALTRLMARRS